MKRLLLLVLYLISLLSVTSAEARLKGPKYEYVYSFFPPVSIYDVTTNDTATVISFIWSTRQGAVRMNLPKLVYLIDSKGKRYRLKAMDGVKAGWNSAKKNTKVKFSMSFAPLPSSETIFDIVSGNSFARTFCFYGVHPVKKGERLAYRSYKGELKQDEFCDNLEEQGNVHIKGHLHGVDGSQGTLKARIHCVNNSEEYDIYTGFQADIDSSGNFELDVKSVGPRWTYLHVDGAEIPLFLHPADTLECEVSHFKQYNQTCMMKSRRGMNLHENLLQADPNGPYLPHLAYLGVGQPLKRTQRMIRDEQAKIDDLYRYLAWKYALTEDEVSLMSLNVRQRLEIIWMRAVCTFRGIDNYSEPDYILQDRRWKVCAESPSLQLCLDRLKD